jgi:Fic family protein
MNRNHLIPPLRERLRRFPPPLENYFGVVPFPPTEEAIAVGDAASDHYAATEALGRADALSREFPNHFLLSRVLVRKEAVASSDIEGTHSTLDALLEVEETDEEEASEADILVRDYAIALEAAITDVESNGYNAFTIHTVEKLHRALMRNDKDFLRRHGEPGEFRRKQVRIGGNGFNDSIYNPPPHTEVLASMAGQISYLRSDGMQQLHQSIITQMAVAHAHFEAINPFPDGNGRVGRLLLPLMLCASGHVPLYLAPYFCIQTRLLHSFAPGSTTSGFCSAYISSFPRY